MILFASLKVLREALTKPKILHLRFHDHLESDVLIHYLSFVLENAKKFEKKGLITITTMQGLYKELSGK
jgi:hypothetical protein